MQNKESLNEVFTRTVVEEFVLPSGKKARRYKFSARDAINLQREFSQRNAGKEKINEDDFQLLIICKCIQLENEKGEYVHPFLEDFDNENFLDGFDFLTLFSKVASLTSEGGGKPNPN